ncbi:hypothetical protein CYMTET_18265 [Cymbomonas tetramitiformis]|uniref:Uncharacterized protein n=1 Tax=Cymbomonas tetramitiformis TaxID=36881 RepID=A0AAE0G8F8_9CHLO|nr:hypothetical protein CYMTET_18265 [Cymbomonas tetramitiformis]
MQQRVTLRSTPATFAQAAQPAGGFAASVFAVATIKTFIRRRFDKSVSMQARGEEVMLDWEARTSGFVSNAHPHDGKRILFEFARRLLHADAPFQATSDLIGVRVLPNKDPHGAFADFNDALTSARRRGTMDDEDVNGLFIIAALDSVYYVPAGCIVASTSSRPTTGDGLADYSAQWDASGRSERSADADLLELIVLMAFMDYLAEAEHVENDLYGRRAVILGGAIDNDDNERFRVDMFSAENIRDFCACSTFDAGMDIDDDMAEHRQYCQPVDTSMTGFHVGGVSLNAFTHATTATMVAPAPAPVTPADAAPSVVSDNAERLYPVSALHVHGARATSPLQT